MNTLNTMLTLTNTDLTIRTNTYVNFFTMTAEARASLLVGLQDDITSNDKKMRELIKDMSIPGNMDLIVFSSIIN